MINTNAANVIIEKVNLERTKDYYGALLESSEEWVNKGGFSRSYLDKGRLEFLLRHALKEWENGIAYMFFIIDTAMNQVVGSAILNHINPIIPMANLAYLVRKSRTGEGIASKAAMLVARYGFEQLGFRRIEIVVSTDNAASLRVAEKVGAVREGLLRNRLKLNGSLCDAYLYSLIPKDYEVNPMTDFRIYHMIHMVQSLTRQQHPPLDISDHFNDKL